MRAPGKPTRYRGRKKGAVTYKYDALLLPALDVMIRTAARDRGMKPFAAIRWFMTPGRQAGGLGASDNALVHRLYQKWRAGAFRKYQPPPGIDPNKFHF